MKPEVIRTSNLAGDAAAFIMHAARSALGERGEIRIGLSGGKTPRPIYTEFGRIACDLPWERVRFTFGDERCVAPDDEQSNYRMARETLFEPFGVPEQSILRMQGEIDPKLAAQQYEDELDLLGARCGEPIYRHDLLLLGMGDDGHTASLFPGTAAAKEQLRRVVANFVPKLDTWRLTMTLPLLNQSRQVLFLVDANKDPNLVQRILDGAQEYPAARVNPPNGKLTWMIAQSA